MHPDSEKKIEIFLQQFVTEAEALLGELAVNAKQNYGDDRESYFTWLQVAYQFKFHRPQIPDAEIEPAALEKSKASFLKPLTRPPQK